MTTKRRKIFALIAGGTVVTAWLAVSGHTTALAIASSTGMAIAALWQQAVSSRRHRRAMLEQEVRTAATVAQLQADADERMVRFVELSREPVFVCAGGRLLYVNHAAITALGYETPEQLTAVPFLDLVEAGEREGMANQLREMLTTGRPAASGEIHLLGRGGDRSTFDAFFLLGDFQAQHTVILLCRDVTERKHTQAHQMLADRMASLGTLAAGVAHEVNNPLSYVATNLEFVSGELTTMAAALSNSGESGADVAGRVETLVKPLQEALHGAQRVRDIVRDLRAFSSGNGPERCWPVELSAVLESAIRMARNEIRYRAEVVRQYAEIPLVDANESRLAQVFLNLLINAAQAIPEGNVPNNEIRVVTSTDRLGRAVVLIQDTGVGIPTEVLPRVFDPFFTTKPSGMGTGLGLAIVHRIVTSFGGEISIESQVGSGTTVRIVLPAAKGMPVSEQPRLPAPYRTGMTNEPPLRVLMVDDEVFINESLRRCVSRYWNASFVSDGREALELLRRDSGYDVIVCDLMMPEVTGMDIYEEISRSRPELCRRMLFMTGGVFTDRSRTFLENLPNRYLEKPFDLAQLTAAVRSVVAN